MRIKYLAITAVLATAILFFGAGANAQADTQALIAQLQAQIQALLQQIAQLQGQTTTAPAWCHTFNKNLRIEDRGADVDALVMALVKEGIIDNSSNENIQGEDFNEQVASAVVEFQEKYASEILTPYKLKRGTGYVGPSTRKKLNALYGCGITQICADSDGGLNYYNKGDLRRGGEIYKNSVDYCINEATLFEYDCGYENGVIGSTHNGEGGSSYTCPNGCENGACKKATTQSSITVLSPNGGEVLTTGQDYTIKWNSYGIPSYQNVKIELGYNHNDPTYAAGNYFEDWIVEKTPNTGSYTWSVPEFYGVGLNSSSFRVKISYSSGVVDYSDANFTIKIGVSNPTLIINPGPIAGANYKSGDKITINWSPKEEDFSYSLNLLKKSDSSFTRWATLYPVFSNGLIQSYYWEVLSGLSGNDYYLRVETSKTASRENIGYSQVFSIVNNSTQPSITVISPNGGERWTEVNTYTITWNASYHVGQKLIDISLKDSRNNYYTYIAKDVNPRYLGDDKYSYAWTVPPGITPGENVFKVRIESIYLRVADETDDYFSINFVPTTIQPMIIKDIKSITSVNPSTVANLSFGVGDVSAQNNLGAYHRGEWYEGQNPGVAGPVWVEFDWDRSQTDVAFIDDNGVQRNIYLPSGKACVYSSASGTCSPDFYWIAQDGSSYYATKSHNYGWPDLSYAEALKPEHLARAAGSAPVISSIVAGPGPVNGYNIITVTGKNLDPLKLAMPKIDGTQDKEGSGCSGTPSDNTKVNCSVNRDLSAGLHTFQLINRDGSVSNVVNFTLNSAWPKVRIASIAPSTANIGSQITINGSGFDPVSNIIQITGGGYYGPRTGGYSKIVPSSNNGTVINFTIPSIVYSCQDLPGYTYCMPWQKVINLDPGDYTVSVINVNTASYGQENQASLKITSGAVIQSSITVLSPNGGETWQSGSKQTIKWITSNVPAAHLILDVRLTNVIGGGTIYLLNNVLNDGSEEITVPTNLDGTYKLELKSSINSDTIYDASDNYFSIVAATPSCTGYADNAVVLNSMQLSNRTVSFNLTNTTPSTQSVSVSIGSGSVSQSAISLPSGACATPTSITYSAPSNTTITFTYSGNIIASLPVPSTTSTQPSITVLSPNGGETWEKNTTRTVAWSSNNIPSSNLVKIIARYYKDWYPSTNYTDYVLVESTSNDGTESVFLSTKTDVAGLPAGQYTLQVKTVVNEIVVDDWSNSYFKIVAPTTQPVVSIFSPNTGEQLQMGGTYDILWDSSKFSRADKVNIILLDARAGYSYYVIAKDFSLSAPLPQGWDSNTFMRMYSWTIPTTGFTPSSANANSFKIYIGKYAPPAQNGDWESLRALAESGVYGYGNSFSIVSASAAPIINEISTGGAHGKSASVMQGQSTAIGLYGYNFTSATGNFCGVNSSALDGITITSNCNVSSLVISFVIQVSQNAVPGDRQLTITTPNGTSNSVTLTVLSSSVNRSIKITSPNGGEVLKFGETHRVTWTSQGIDKVAISVYNDTIFGSGSTNYLDPARTSLSVPASQGYFDWTILQNWSPKPTPGNENRYKISISDVNADATGIRDVSDNYFSIVAPTTQPTFAVTFPTAGVALNEGSTYNLSWTGSDPGVTSYQIDLAGGALGNTATKFLGIAYVSQGSSFSWTISNDITPASGYQIQFTGIRATGGSSGGGKSGLFAIVPSSSSSLMNLPDNLLASISEAIAKIAQGIEELSKK
ncbi:MAG: hypothetical protein CEN87_90 [Parcubacteria group bacterium Licking1014_1]|nr:MAG: hypothetical protein CEN87_90 [Parcubacteria group bacterium Licking1014_1]